MNKSQPFSKEWLETFRQRKLAGNTLEAAVGQMGNIRIMGIPITMTSFIKTKLLLNPIMFLLVALTVR